MMNAKTALFLGRFQPFHKGHEKALSWLLARHLHAMVAIGSSNRRREEENPFSASERKRMMKCVFAKHAGWSARISFSFVPDCERHSDWMKSMLAKFSPRKFVFYSNNPLVRKLFAAQEYEVKPIPLYKRYLHEGAKIRKLVAGGKEYAGRMPPVLRAFMAKTGEKIILESSQR